MKLTCWSASDSLVIGIQVRNLSGQLHSPAEELVLIDTGYTGELLIPYVLFQNLHLKNWRLPRSTGPLAETVSGQIIRLLEANLEVIIPKTGEVHQVLAQTFIGNTRFLIGREFLRRFQILFDGPGRKTCLLTSTSG